MVKRALLLSLLAFGCAGAPGGGGLVRPGTPDAVNLAKAREAARPPAIAWQPWSAETFARAKRERRFILLHGAAEWCHWCHVMEATTYRNPEVGRLVRERFVAIKVDVDARPDIEERYGAWGWPATIILGPDAEELGKYRGYLPPEELRAILSEVRASGADAERERALIEPGIASATPAALPWVARRALHDMDGYYDDERGGWGFRQKAPVGANLELEARRALSGDAAARRRALQTARRQRALMDPVWGGLYQYSTGGDWNEPHFEKLMTFQASNLEAYARVYAATRAADVASDARAIVRYVDRFMTSPAGTFYTNQDADVGAHDPKSRFVDGHVYYSNGEAARLALGVPWVDRNVYPHENGLMIAALVTLWETTRDAGVLSRAKRAADALLATHLEPTGAVRRTPEKSSPVRYLADAASFGRALARLAEATGEARYRDHAVAIAAFAQRELADPQSDAFFAHTPDPDAAGVFATRRRPLTHNVLCARFFAALAVATGDAAWAKRARRTLAAVATPAALDEQGRMIGAFLLALDEAGVSPWPKRQLQATTSTSYAIGSLMPVTLTE